MKRFLMTLAALLLCFSAAFAQNEKREVRRGNRQFGREKYQECEISYKKALLADSLSAAANYNLGNTYYRLQNYAEADKAYAAVQDSLVRKPADIAKRYHNAGNSMLSQRNWQGAIEAYKNALRRNPGDMETKANLAYAQKMLENEQQNQDQNQDQDQNNDQNQDQNKDQNKDQNQDQNKDQNNDQNQNQDQNNDQNDDKNQDQNKDNQDQNHNNDQNQDQQNQDGQQPRPQPKISQQDAQQILQAIQDKEKETQDKVNKEKALMLKSKQKEKNW